MINGLEALKGELYRLRVSLEDPGCLVSGIRLSTSKCTIHVAAVGRAPLVTLMAFASLSVIL